MAASAEEELYPLLTVAYEGVPFNHIVCREHNLLISVCNQGRGGLDFICACPFLQSLVVHFCPSLYPFLPSSLSLPSIPRLLLMIAAAARKERPLEMARSTQTDQESFRKHPSFGHNRESLVF